MNQTIVKNREKLDDGVLLQLTGEIDLSCSPMLRQAILDELDHQPDRIVIDLNDVTYMDSSGVATLVEGLQRLKKTGGKLYLCQLQPRVRSIFEISRLDSVFTLMDDLEAALSA